MCQRDGRLADAAHRAYGDVQIVHSLLHYDVLYLGGGNATNIVGSLPDNVRIASNDAGITGGIRLWDEVVWSGILNSHVTSSVH